MSIIIKNIKELVQVEEKPELKVCGKDMAFMKTIKNAYLFIKDGLIDDFGEMKTFIEKEKLFKNSKTTVIDATGKMVFPSFCDSHTHLVYANSREIEYIDKIKG